MDSPANAFHYDIVIYTFLDMFTTFVTTTITGKSNIGTADETDIHLHVFQKMQKRGWTNVAEMDKNLWLTWD